LCVSKRDKILLKRKSLAFVPPYGKKYLMFILLKVRKEKLSKFSKTCFTTTKETALSPFNLAHPVKYFANYVGVTCHPYTNLWPL